MNKIEKLERKHIAPYLSYDVYAYDEEQESKTDKIVGIFHNTLDFENWSPLNSNIDHYKLCLLPLSALTEQLPDGSIPIEEMYELFGSKSGFGKLFYQSDLLESLKKGINEVKHKHVEYLFSKHFDVYGLIESGLAIDKRTVKL